MIALQENISNIEIGKSFIHKPRDSLHLLKLKYAILKKKDIIIIYGEYSVNSLIQVVCMCCFKLPSFCMKKSEFKQQMKNWNSSWCFIPYNDHSNRKISTDYTHLWALVRIRNYFS